MRAVDVGVGHDDDLLVAQVFFAVAIAGAAAEREQKIGKLLVAFELSRACARDIEDLAAQGQNRLRRAVARLFCGAAG